MAKTKRISSHILFWLFAALFLSLFLGKKADNYQMVFFFVVLLLPVASATSYSFNYFLIPKYLFQEKHFKFFLYAFFTVVLSVYVEMLLIVFAFIFLANYQIENMIPGTANIINLGVGMYFVVVLSALIYLVKRKVLNPPKSLKEVEQPKDTTLTVRANRETVKLDTTTILYIESLDNYVKIHQTDQELIVRERISHLADRLPESFMRIHRSFLVNNSQIQSYTREAVQVNGKKLPISRTYKKQVIGVLEGM